MKYVPIMTAFLYGLISINFITSYSSSLDYDYVNSLIDQGRYDAVLSYLEKLSLESPNDIDILFYQGYVLDEIGRYDEALNYYDQVLWYAPKDIETLYNKAVTLENLGKYDEALEYYDRVLEVDSNDIDSLLSKAILLNERGDYQESQRLLDEVLKNDPENLAAKSYLQGIEETEGINISEGGKTTIIALVIVGGLALTAGFVLGYRIRK